jgi:hypothetical protein
MIHTEGARAAANRGRLLIGARRHTHLMPLTLTMHERDDLVVQQFIHVSILRCNSFMYKFSGLHLIHVYALASSPVLIGDERKILVPAETRTKTRFAAIKQALSRPERGRCREFHSLVVAVARHSHSHSHSHIHSHIHSHRPAPVQQLNHVHTTSWVCT